jgi:uncharacterized protein YndB with AHSA1/START domain
MTTLVNEITIEAPRAQVWRVLSDLERLERYDPGVRSSRLVDGPGPAAGLGASRRCELRPGGWFVEQVTDWRPDGALAFDLVTCSLPVRRLRHTYTLTEVAAPGSGRATLVRQTMTYDLKYAALGRALDATVMRRQWDRGIKAFLAGLREQVLAGRSTSAAE